MAADAKVTGYCVKEKAKNRVMVEAKEITLKNGRKAVTGKCEKCGTKMFEIGGLK